MLGSRFAGTGALLVVLSLPPLLADASSPRSRVRTADREIQAAIDEGVRHSPAFGRLIARIEASDLIVYVSLDWFLPPGLGGRTALAAKAGGVRYVAVKVSRWLSPQQRIGLVAHELQHAVEIAEEPSIVDAASLAAYYRAYGTPAPCRRECYESLAARRVERQVVSDLVRGVKADAQD